MSRGKSHSFNEFVDTQLHDLRDRFGMAMWFLIRRRNEEWLALRVCGDGYDLEGGNMLAWRDSICYRRVNEEGPIICPDVSKEAAYRSAPVTSQLKIGAYVGLPLLDQHGNLFGTLCALDPEPQRQLHDPTIQAALRRQAHLLETALVWNLAGLDQQRITDFFEEEGRDPETGLLDAGGWIRILDRERVRCRDYGLDAMILRLHGDRLSLERREQLADSVAALIREQDMAAHLGDGQFAILLTESTPHCAARVRERILDALNAKDLWVECNAEPLTLQIGLAQPHVLLDGAVH
ncbi:diguanylate cyclase [Alcanivorax sp. N3-2A]|nr:diguanylate cyclase [Alcanivorax sp. N3-2A]|tara:strand:+ start:88151 stop:89029 length:879 start_codon:yes stop_codon:yes gene_type:complete